jgi:hypothetical protein
MNRTEYPIPETIEMFDLRKQLSRLNHKIPNYPIGIMGVSLFKNADVLKKLKIDECFHYVLDYAKDKKSELRKALDSPPIPPEPGAFVFYYDTHVYFNDWPEHVGRVLEDGYVLSKWGYVGHAYKHLPQLVPLIYGNLMRFHRGV